MPGLVPGIHVFSSKARRGWPGQTRPWRRWVAPGFRSARPELLVI